jgi:maleate isomerase
MGDGLAWRMKFGVVTPSTNTIVQPEYDDLRPPGVTNHVGRMHIPDDPVTNDADFDELIRRIDVALEEAVDRVMTCKPDHMILGISAESIWGGGLEAAEKVKDRMRERSGGLGVTLAADALPAALKAHGVAGKVGLLTPYMPTAEKHIQKFMDDIGYDVSSMVHLRCGGPVVIAHTTRAELRAGLQQLADDGADAIVQFGANLPMGRFAAVAEQWLDGPVICVNVATYWHALRVNGITDKVEGYGALMERY